MARCRPSPPACWAARTSREEEPPRKADPLGRASWCRSPSPLPPRPGRRAGPPPWLTATLVAGLLLFGFVFAVNSSVHSYLILAFGSADRITRDVGFYYMANAAGRLMGTLLSGLSYQIGGLPLCLATAGVMAGASWLGGAAAAGGVGCATARRRMVRFGAPYIFLPRNRAMPSRASANRYPQDNVK